MLLRVNLASRDVLWIFQDSARLRAWLDGVPWIHNGGVLPIRVSGPRQAQILSAALPTAVRTADGGGSEVATRVLERSNRSRTAAGVLSDALEVELKGGGLDRRDVEAIGRELSIRPAVIVLDATGWDRNDARGALDALSQVGASASKLFCGAALTAIILHDTPLWAGGDELVFDLGHPTFSVVDHVASPDSVLWSAYLHQRLAWETGGELDRALAWNEALTGSGVRTGEDDQLESFLNERAAVSWSTAPQRVSESIQTFLRTSGNDRTQVRLRSDLEQERALWRPAGVTRPVPWASRALLLRDPTPLLRAQLRWCLICAPLRRDLLAWALDTEASARARHSRDLGDPPEEARADWEYYRSGAPTSDARFYPAGSPATPDGPFAFVELGGFLSSLRTNPLRMGLLHRLRILRNYLAHGQYVSWACVREMIDIQRGLNSLPD